MCCSVKFRTEELGIWAELVLLELRQEFPSTGAAAMEVGDSMIFKGVIWKAGMLTAFSSDPVTGMTPETETQRGGGLKTETQAVVLGFHSLHRMSLAHSPLRQASVRVFATHPRWASCRLCAVLDTPQLSPCQKSLPCCHGCTG